MKAIFASDPTGGIGCAGLLPWDGLDGDLPRFRELTMGNTLVMGRITWESIGSQPLVGRKHIVVSSQNLDVPSEVTVVRSVDDIPDSPDHWCVGGAELLKALWSRITEFHLTRAADIYDNCDAFISLLYLEQNFKMVYQTLHDDNTYEVWVRL